MASIRPYERKDKERVQALCIENAECSDASEDLKDYILHMYCNYYIEVEPENCFVAVDEYDRAVGYIICSENYAYYERKFKEFYLSHMQELGLNYYIDAKMDMITHSMLQKEYPAHFHIDILDGYQRQGIGSQLIETLQFHMKGKGIRSLMLVVGEDNEKGRNFYKKNGFSELIITHLGVAMGIQF